jgi:uncharacterized surface protein with fasciclin (FAS1) repeats
MHLSRLWCTREPLTVDPGNSRGGEAPLEEAADNGVIHAIDTVLMPK